MPDIGWDDGAPAASVGHGLSVKHILSLLWRRKFRVLLVFVLLWVPAVFVILKLPRSYTAEALLVLRVHEPQPEELRPLLGQNSIDSEANINLIRSEMQILNSQELAQRVVQSLHLEGDAKSEQAPSQFEQLADAARGYLGLEPPLATKGSDQRVEQAVRGYHLHFAAFNDGKSLVIAVSFAAPDPDLATRILATHLRFYLADQVAEKDTALNAVHVWLAAELGKLAAKVQTSEQQLQQFRGANNLLRSGGETFNSHQLDDLVAQLGKSRADLMAKQARLQDIASASHGDGDAAILASPLIQRDREQEAQLTAQSAEMRQRFSSSYPGVRSMAAALGATRESIANEISRMMRSAQGDVDVATVNVHAIEKEVSRLSQAANADELTDLTKAQLQRETDANRQLYGDLLRRADQVEIQRQFQQEPNVRVVSQPAASVIPSSPHRAMLLLTSTGLLALASCVANVLLDRNRLQSRSLLEIEAMTRVPGLTSVPHVRLQRQGQRRFLTEPDQRSLFALSLQTLRNSLTFHGGGVQPKVVVFTSALPGEGKTFLSAFYAQSLSFTGARVLLVDADLRQSSLAQLFKVKPYVGIEAALAGTASLSACVRRVAGLDFQVLLSRKCAMNPHDLLDTGVFAKLMEEARGLYDFIIVDTPPIAAVDDALPVAKVADATVLVIRWGETPHDVVRGTIRRLRLGGAKVTGVVLNAVDMAAYQASSSDLEAYRPLRSPYVSHER